jgi:hypothetical protein
MRSISQGKVWGFTEQSSETPKQSTFFTTVGLANALAFGSRRSVGVSHTSFGACAAWSSVSNVDDQWLANEIHP